MPLSLVGTTLAATTARQGPIQLASDGEAVVSRAVQADDTRLGTAATAGVSAGDLVFGTGEDGALDLNGGAVTGMSLTGSDENIMLKVLDDGIGIGDKRSEGPGMGLRIMAYRASLIGATMQISAGSERGTLVSCSVPRGRGH